MANSNLTAAKKAKNDEFYTQISDIENELKHYKDHFQNKIVYCNCDDPIESNFCRFFILKFADYGLKKLICTAYKTKGHGKVYSCEGDITKDGVINESDLIVRDLECNGDFRSPECIAFLKEADIVVTNPPFSLFREYIAQLIEYDKKFLVIGPDNAITYKEIFPLIKDNKLWVGCNKVKLFTQPNGETKSFGNIGWFTNITHKKRKEKLTLYKKYNATDFPKYDNYDAINVDKVTDIPEDYNGVMGVPITFLDKYCPEQFEILECHEPATSLEKLKQLSKFKEYKSRQIVVKGVLCQKSYHRIFIRKKQ